MGAKTYAYHCICTGAHSFGLVLVSSVGYIVGLGDRHIQNILIDEQTAELIHIDLGKKSLHYNLIQ